MTDKPEPQVLDLQSLVPDPRPEIYTLLGAAEAGLKNIRKMLELKNHPRALAFATTVKAAIVSIEALLQEQITDTLTKIMALGVATQTMTGDLDAVLAKIEKVAVDKPEDVKVEDGKGSGYL